MKCHCRSNLLQVSVLNFKRLNILLDSIRLPTEKLLSFEFATSFGFKFLASRIYYGTQSVFRVKCYCCSNLLQVSVLNFERLDILLDSIRLPTGKLLSFEFATSFGFKFLASRIYYGTQSDFRVKCYCCSNLLQVSVLNFERLDILLDSIRLPTEKLL